MSEKLSWKQFHCNMSIQYSHKYSPKAKRTQQPNGMNRWMDGLTISSIRPFSHINRRKGEEEQLELQIEIYIETYIKAREKRILDIRSTKGKDTLLCNYYTTIPTIIPPTIPFLLLLLLCYFHFFFLLTSALGSLSQQLATATT